MLAFLGILATLALAPQDPAGEPLLELGARIKLRTVTGEVAKTGEDELVERLSAVLRALGDDERELERLGQAWARTLAAAKPNRSTRAATAGRMRRELDALTPFATVDPARRTELARLWLELDSEDPAANAVLLRERDEEGRWLAAEERLWQTGARAVAGWLNTATRSDFDCEHGTSTNPALAALGGGNYVRAEGIELHSNLGVEALARILRQALRGAVFSNGLLHERERLPKLVPRRFLLLSSEEQAAAALEEALAQKGLTEEAQRQAQELRLRSFFDARGWETVRWAREAELSALVLSRLLGDWLAPDVQPCLRVGHLNFVCLSVLGTALPLSIWLDVQSSAGAAQLSSARRATAVSRSALWRSVRQSLWGCRSWMLAEARAGRDPPWARAMLDQDGKIRDENLLKTTLVCALLQQEGRMPALLAATRGATDPVAAFERALGEDLPTLERRWKRWLDPRRTSGVLQELRRDVAGPVAVRYEAGLYALNRARADALKGQGPEIPVVALDPELCRAAELHARYLSLNPEQKPRWPQAHEEFPSARGFSVEGALAAGRAVIAYDGDPAASVRGWLGTFYHRLPLLDPGLFGVGFGTDEEVVVLDARSLVLAPWKDHVVLWPLEGAVNVPTRFVPELPNPVPGADLANLGMPVSVQLFFAEPSGLVELTLELFTGPSAAGAPVECHRISPQEPLQPELVPENAWGLIPHRPLAPKTRYTARARWNGAERVWSFTTGE